MPDGTYDLRSKAFKARAKIFDVADMFHSKGNISWPSAIQEAMNWYKGQGRESVIKQKVIKDIKAQEKRVTPRRVGKSVVKTYESEEEEKADVVMDAMKKAGVDAPDNFN